MSVTTEAPRGTFNDYVNGIKPKLTSALAQMQAAAKIIEAEPREFPSGAKVVARSLKDLATTLGTRLTELADPAANQGAVAALGDAIGEYILAVDAGLDVCLRTRRAES